MIETPVPEAPSLIDAVRALVSVMRYRSMDLEQSAQRIEAYDRQPYPLSYVIMSNHITALLRALAAAERAEPPVQTLTAPRTQYGPPRRVMSRG
jgi:hypothetical protein